MINLMMSRKFQTGQAMAEFSISIPFLAPIVLVMIMLLIQWATIYRDKMTLNAATFEAARAGSLNNGSKAKMRDALAQGMVPIFMRDESSALEVGRAYLMSKLYVEGSAIAKAGAQINILSPTPEIFDKHKVTRSDRHGNRWQEIPNDNLMYRKSDAKKITDEQHVNIQDANLLKIEVNWCKKLEVPIANWVIGKILTLTDPSPNPLDAEFVMYSPHKHQLGCNALGAIAGAGSGYSDYYISIKSYALIRMQTPFKI